MKVKIKWQEYRLIDIDPDNGSFYVQELCTKRFVGLCLESETSFDSISLEKLTARNHLGQAARLAEPIIHPCHFNRYFPHVKHLHVHDVPLIILKWLGIPGYFDNLVHLHYSHFRASSTDFRTFELGRGGLPPNLKRLELVSISLKFSTVPVDQEIRKIKLDIFTLEDCIVSDSFFEMFTTYMEVDNFKIEDYDKVLKPKLETVRHIWGHEKTPVWSSLIFRGLSWDDTNFREGEATEYFIQNIIKKFKQ